MRQRYPYETATIKISETDRHLLPGADAMDRPLVDAFQSTRYGIGYSNYLLVSIRRLGALDLVHGHRGRIPREKHGGII